MINNIGQWEENKDYTTSPQTEWCDMDYMAAWIRSKGYEIKTTMENLITMIFLHFECEMENENDLYFSIENCQEYVEASGGLQEFDYEC